LGGSESRQGSSSRERIGDQVPITLSQATLVTLTVQRAKRLKLFKAGIAPSFVGDFVVLNGTYGNQIINNQSWSSTALPTFAWAQAVLNSGTPIGVDIAPPVLRCNVTASEGGGGVGISMGISGGEMRAGERNSRAKRGQATGKKHHAFSWESRRAGPALGKFRLHKPSGLWPPVRCGQLPVHEENECPKTPPNARWSKS